MIKTSGSGWLARWSLNSNRKLRASTWFACRRTARTAISYSRNSRGCSRHVDRSPDRLWSGPPDLAPVIAFKKHAADLAPFAMGLGKPECVTGLVTVFGHPERLKSENDADGI